MMTIFGLFKGYEEAREAVDLLMENGAEMDELNVLVQADAARAGMEIDRSRAGVDVTDKVGDVELHGLDRLVAGQQAMPVRGIGDLYATGELATMIASAAQGLHQEDRGLEGALEEFGLSADKAASHRKAIRDAGWVVVVRTEDAKARELLALLHDHAQELATVTR